MALKPIPTSPPPWNLDLTDSHVVKASRGGLSSNSSPSRRNIRKWLSPIDSRISCPAAFLWTLTQKSSRSAVSRLHARFASPLPSTTVAPDLLPQKIIWSFAVADGRRAVNSISSHVTRGIPDNCDTQSIPPHRKERKAAALRERLRCTRHRSSDRTHRHP